MDISNWIPETDFGEQYEIWEGKTGRKYHGFEKNKAIDLHDALMMGDARYKGTPLQFSVITIYYDRCGYYVLVYGTGINKKFLQYALEVIGDKLEIPELIFVEAKVRDNEMKIDEKDKKRIR